MPSETWLKRLSTETPEQRAIRLDNLRQYGREHRASQRVKDRERYATDPGLRQKKLARVVKWQTANKERQRETLRRSKHRRRALLAGAGGSYSKQEWEALKKRYGYRCLCCCRHASEFHHRWEVDHIVPISDGGTNSIDNLQPLCFRCNRRKSARTVDFRSEGFYLREVDPNGNVTNLGHHLLVK